MDKIGHQPAPELLAGQVAESRYFFLPTRRARTLGGAAGGPTAWRLALGGWEVCRADYAVRRSRYPYHVVELIVAGRGRAIIDGRTTELEAGVCFAYGPTARCELRAEEAEPLRKYFFALAGAGAARALAEAGLGAGSARRLVVVGELAALADAIVTEGRRHGRHAEAVCGHLTAALLLRLAEGDTADELADSEARARESYERCRARVDAHAREWRSLADIAAGCGLERSSVCRLFRRFAGTTPGRYLLRRKMNLAAARLIEHGGWVKEVAAYVGLADPLHFSRCFRQAHGVPPSALLSRSGSTEGNQPRKRSVGVGGVGRA